MKKNIKIFLHHEIDQNVQLDKKLSSWQITKKMFFGFFNFIYKISYQVGLSLISIPKIPKLVFKQLASINFHKPNWQRSLGFLILIAVAISPIYLLRVASEGQKLGGRILGISDNIFEDLDSAQAAIKNQDYGLAQNNFAGALTQLQTAQTQLNQSSLFLQSIVNFAPASYNSANALKAAELLTDAASRGSGLLSQVNQFRFSPEGLSLTNGQPTKEALTQIQDNVSIIDAHLTEANQLLGPLDSSSLPAKYQSTLKDSQDLVKSLSTQIHALNLATKLFTSILLGDKKFLVLLQNNNELRPTGGFIGTIAQGKLTDASIKNLDIRSVYDLDGQLLDFILPPTPELAVNSRLFLRDSNWLANFPESAQRLSTMYEKEGGETPDLIMALTPDLFIDLLNLTGPITLPTYKVTISSSNFIEQIQSSTSLAYDKNLNQPKQLLADLYPSLLQKIGQSSGILSLLQIMQTNLSDKNIIIYSRDPVLQKGLTDLHWSGQLTSTQKDYLSINSANLGGTKTDRLLERNASLQTTIQTDGTIINQVRYTVTNPLPNNPGLLNRSFVRFFVPLNSKLLAADGFSEISMTSIDPKIKYQTDSAIDEWNHNFVYDQSHKIYSGTESGKSFFANWLEVLGGESKTVTVTYQLPFKLNSIDNYSLLWEKQSGMIPFEASQEITYSNKDLLWDNLGNQSREVSKPDKTRVDWKISQMIQDQFIGLVLKDAK